MQLFKHTDSDYLVGTPHEILGKRKDGGLFPISRSVSKVARPGCPTFVGVIRDITERPQQEAEIQRLAFYDQLTQLPNRHSLLDRLKQALMTLARSGQRGALMFLDLDHFKLLGGDEFVVLLEGLSATASEGAADAECVAHKVLDKSTVPAYWRAVRTLRGSACGWLVRNGLMSSPPRRV